ncbi:trigger factor [Zavarzinia sp. CC-PAN008]|uniref:trigger factor n=1 Tax=Zavarzinia sp. CC-PAN008 TaxID=3243332 RepID=UPI003F749A48
MEVTQTSAEGLRREFRVVLNSGDIGARVETRLKQLSGAMRMPGFRPGKVPVALIRKTHGKAVLGEVLEQAVNESSRSAIEDNKLRPALQPRIEVTKFGEDEGLEYTMAVEVLPDVEPGEFSGVSLERLTVPVEEAEVEQSLERLASSQKRFEAAPEGTEAAEGNAVVIDFLGKKDGVPFDGGEAKDFQLELGSKRFIPGFEDQLIGAKVGDERVIALNFPDDYPVKELAGQPVTFDVTVKEVQSAAAVSIDDEFAKSFGVESLADLRATLRKQLESRYGDLSRMRLKRALLDALAEQHSFEVPQGLVDLELEQIVAQAEPELRQVPDQELDEEKKARRAEKDGEWRPIAERRVRLGLLLAEVGRRNNIQVKPEEVNRAVMEEARRYPGQEKEVFEFFQKNAQAQAQLRAPILEEKVVDFILELVKITDRQVSLEELRRAAEESDDTDAPASEA